MTEVRGVLATGWLQEVCGTPRHRCIILSGFSYPFSRHRLLGFVAGAG